VAAGATLTLVEVADIQGAQRRSDNAFSLLFKGPRGAAADGPTSLRHPELGGFELFLAPVAAPGADQRYEAVINRSVAPSAPADPPAAPALVAAPPPAGPRARVRRAIARRSARGAVVTLTVGPEVEEISAWLVRGGRVLAASSRAAVRGRRVRIRMRTRRPLRAGRHHVVVIATAADGTTGSARIRVRRR
jgi:hypothetical protein